MGVSVVQAAALPLAVDQRAWFGKAESALTRDDIKMNRKEGIGLPRQGTGSSQARTEAGACEENRRGANFAGFD
jgi:hypothetical protein